MNALYVVAYKCQYKILKSLFFVLFFIWRLNLEDKDL